MSVKGKLLDQFKIKNHITIKICSVILYCLCLAWTADAGAVEDAELSELLRSLHFEPPHIEFGSWSVGMARSHTVTLVNKNSNRSVYLSSVSGSTPAFYSSFFEAKVVPPLTNTTFNVVFLPRERGAISTDLLIHTSFGQAHLWVSGEGRECPYRLKPIVGIKAPLNANLTTEIHMYNPHERHLQILEVYSSGGQFQLELPSGGQEGPQVLWEIPPHSMKPVIRIRFNGRTAGNHTAYIRIKILEQPKDSLGSIENVLVVPVEFQILPQPGLYAETPLIDFGRVTTHAKKAMHIQLKLINSIERRTYELIGYDLRKVDGLTFDMNDTTITFDPKLFGSTAMFEEILLLRSATRRNSSIQQEFSVIIRAEVFRGTLAYEQNITRFITQASDYVHKEQRVLVVRNDFELPLALLKVNMEHTNPTVLIMHLSETYSKSGTVVMSPGTSFELLHLQVVNNASEVFKTVLHIQTNVTLFEVPIFVCSGKLHVSTHITGRVLINSKYNIDLNIGIIPLTEMSSNGFIMLRNSNPLAVKLSTWDFQSPPGVYFHTTFMGCLHLGPQQAPNNETITVENSKFRFCSHLEEGDAAVFQVAIQSYITDSKSATLKIWSAFEVINIIVNFRAWVGKLEVDQEKLYFKNCFPGKLCSSDLSIRSTFQHPIHITSINFTDAGLRFEEVSPNGSTIVPEAVTKIGRIYFEPALLCLTRCYIPQEEQASSIAFPKGGRNNNLHFDDAELRRRTELFRHLKWYFQTISFTLSSEELRQFLLQLIIDIEWPKLVLGKQTSATIEVGKVQQIPVVITNPANTPVLVDYFLADPYFAKETSLSLPLEVVDISSNCYLTDKSVFALFSSPLRKPLLLLPHSNITVQVLFEASESGTFCSLLHVRNNLTLYEAVWLSAKSVQSQFRFGNRKPGSTTPLLFEVSEKHLAACSDKTVETIGKEFPSKAITKRIFTARNTGEIPISVETFLIGDAPCEGYGFKVIDCTSFELKANASRKIEIAFTPDFSVTRITRPLTLKTNLTYDVNYVLLAQMPPVSVDKCLQLLPRPPWEAYIRKAAISLLAATFIFVLIAAHIDYSNILYNQTTLYISRDGPVHPTFNLRNIAVRSQQLSEEISAPIATTQPQTSRSSSQQKPSSAVTTSSSTVTTSSSTVTTANSTVTTASSSVTTAISNASNNNSLKKRIVKKSNSSENASAESIALPEFDWPIELSTSAQKQNPSKNTPTFSERNFKLRLEAEKVCAQSVTSSSSVSSSESSTKSLPVPPKPTTTPPSEKDQAVTVNAGSSGASKKQHQREKNVKKTKHAFQGTTEKRDVVEEYVASTPKAVRGKCAKNVSKAASQTSTTIIKSPITVHTPTADAPQKPVAEITPPDASATVKQPPPNAGKTSNSTRKHGKTPGRERKKNIQYNAAGTFETNNSTTSSTSSSSCSNPKRSERKQKSKAVNALNFSVNASPTFDGSGDAAAANSLASSQVSFSEVLQRNSPVSTPECSCGDLREMNKTGSHHSLLDIDFDRNLRVNGTGTTFPLVTDIALDKNNFPELGPIGTKKSPSSTPLWEPVASTSNLPTNIQLPKPILSNNSSFFSNLLPTYAYEDNQSFMSVPSDLYELKKTQEQLQRQWQTNEYILNLHQQKLQTAQQLLPGVDATSNWSLNSPTWSPLGYAQNVTNAPTLGPWQTGCVIRPPPGLEANFQTISSTQQHQQQQKQQQQQPQQQPPPPPSQADADIPAFDPFSSLSSIWSDNWNNSHNNRNNLN